MTQVSIMQDVRDPLGLHLNQKDLKLGRKWPIIKANLHMGGCVSNIGSSFHVWKHPLAFAGLYLVLRLPKKAQLL